MAIPTRLTPREGRRFAFTVGAAFLVLAGISLWRGHFWPPRVMGVIGGALLLAGLVVPGRLTLVNHWWMSLASAISKVTSPISVGLLYFVVLTPLGALMRLAGRNPIRHREVNGGYWKAAPEGGQSDLETHF